GSVSRKQAENRNSGRISVECGRGATRPLAQAMWLSDLYSVNGMIWNLFVRFARAACAFTLLALALSLNGCAGLAPPGSSAAAAPTVTPAPTATATIAPTPTPKPTFVDPLTTNSGDWPTARGRCEFAHGGMQVSNAICALPFFDAEDGAI